MVAGEGDEAASGGDRGEQWGYTWWWQTQDMTLHLVVVEEDEAKNGGEKGSNTAASGGDRPKRWGSN